MKRLIVGLCAVAVAVVAVAASKRPRTLEDAFLTVDPNVISSPLGPDTPVIACIHNLTEGDVATIAVPWVSNNGVNVSRLSDTGDVDASGTFCLAAPPDWTTLRLVPGTYNVISRAGTSRAGDTLPGPSATLTVVP